MEIHRALRFSHSHSSRSSKEAMQIICKNCAHRFTDKFCNHCGQAADTHRLTMHFIWHDLQHGLFHVDHGIFYTIKQLLTRPGQAIREFIDGKRIQHFKPATFVVVLATLYGLLFHYFISDLHGLEPIHARENVLSVFGKVTQWITAHFAYATLLLIVTTTLSSFLLFKKQGYNFAEHLVLNTFYRGLVLVVNILLFPVLYTYRGTEIYILGAQLTDLTLMYWCYAQFFNRLSKIESLGLTVLAYLMMSGINVGIGYSMGWITNFVS